MHDERIRSFIAVELPEDVKSGLDRLQDEIRETGYTPIKWVAAGSIHLTLKFLGDVASLKVSQVTRVMEEVSWGFGAFKLGIGDLGAFPGLRRPRVLWVSINGQVDRLTDLQERIDAALVPLGFAREARPFTPHLTLARLRERASSQEQQAFGELVTKMQAKIDCEINVNSLSLMRSQLLPGGAVYSCLSEVRLEGFG